MKNIKVASTYKHGIGMMLETRYGEQGKVIGREIDKDGDLVYKLEGISGVWTEDYLRNTWIDRDSD